MKVGITGASGFIGKNVVLNIPKDWKTYAFYFSSKDFPNFLTKNNLHNILPIQVDLTKTKEVEKISTDIGKDFDKVLYLASNGNPAYSVENPVSDLKSNTLGLINFFNNFNCEKAVYFSSGAVYDGLKGLVNPESKVDPTLPYSISKLASEQYIKFFADRKNSIGGYTLLRFFGAFGPNEPERKIYTKLIDTFHFKNKNEFTIRGGGENYIDAMYVEDAVEGILKCINNAQGNRLLDFGAGDPITINELVRRTAKTLGKDNINIIHEGEVPEYIKFKISPKPFEQEFSFKRKYSLEQGIKKFTEFLKENYK